MQIVIQVAYSRKEEVLRKRSWGVMAESRLQSLPPTLRMLFKPSLAFRVQVWLIARVAKNCMHQYTQESKCIINGRSNSTL